MCLLRTRFISRKTLLLRTHFITRKMSLLRTRFISRKTQDVRCTCKSYCGFTFHLPLRCLYKAKRTPFFLFSGCRFLRFLKHRSTFVHKELVHAQRGKWVSLVIPHGTHFFNTHNNNNHFSLVFLLFCFPFIFSKHLAWSIWHLARFGWTLSLHFKWLLD